MENGPGTLGLEDGAIDVERLLVEPQDVHESMDSVMCFNEKIPESAMSMEDVSRSSSFGCSNHGFADQQKDTLNREVLDGMRSEELGYYRMQSDFCSIEDEYLLGVDFAESITNLEYSSSGRLQTSVSDGLILPSCAVTGSPWKSDLFRVEVPGCQADRADIGNVSSRPEYDTFGTEKPLKSPTSCSFRDLEKFHDISSCSFEEVLSDENDGSVSTLPEMLCDPKIEKNDNLELTQKDCESRKSSEQDASATISTPGDSSDTFPVQKRLRKPTRRYIDEVEDPVLKLPKKRQVVSSSLPKSKDLGAKSLKKSRTGSSAVRLPVEETSVEAIQVPFAAVTQNECSKTDMNDIVRSKDIGNSTVRPKESRVTSDNQKKTDECVALFHPKRSYDYNPGSEKKRDDGVSVAYLRKRSERLGAASQRKRGNFVISVIPKKRDDFDRTVDMEKDDFITAASPKRKDENVTLVSSKRRNNCYTVSKRKKGYSSDYEEVSGRRKHHILWTVTEIKNLLDGVSQYGVGRWSRIKKLFFSSSAHRTSVDLKDKWRNLLKASGILERSKSQGRKKRNAAWRPLPPNILARVCELAAMYPYPKGRRLEISNDDNLGSPDRSTDITLSDYRRILRSINDN